MVHQIKEFYQRNQLSKYSGREEKSGSDVQEHEVIWIKMSYPLSLAGENEKEMGRGNPAIPN